MLMTDIHAYLQNIDSSIVGYITLKGSIWLITYYLVLKFPLVVLI